MVTDFYAGENSPTARSFSDKENRCKKVFDWTRRKFGPVWHLCTPGHIQQVIFRKKEHYTYGMTLVAMCAYDSPNVRIITFELMSNHVHFVLCGEKEYVLAFFALFKKRLQRYFSSINEKVSLNNFVCGEPIVIDNLESLRNQICYTNRNNFVIDPDQTPFSYPYGANGYFFLNVAKSRKECCFGDLTEREKRAFLHSRSADYPLDYIIVDNYFSPVNFCRLDIGEGIFRDARHYFNKLVKNVESYKDIAETLGDTIYYTDDELSDVLYRICRDKFEGQRPTLLTRDEKLELARTLHYDYNADNAKIVRLIGLSRTVVDALFPLRK